MQEALESLLWVRKAEIHFDERQALVTVEAARYVAADLVAALEKAGFGGKVVSDAGDEQRGERKKQAAVALERIAFHVTGMKKTKSGAT